MKRVSKAELEALKAAVDYFECEGLPLYKALKSLLEKFNDKAKAAAEPGSMTPAQIENILVQFSSDKVVPVTAARDIFWIKQYNLWKGYGPNPEQVELVARWLGRQTWMSPMTLDQIAYKWPQYLSKAKAETRVSGLSNGSCRTEFMGED